MPGPAIHVTCLNELVEIKVFVMLVIPWKRHHQSSVPVLCRRLTTSCWVELPPRVPSQSTHQSSSMTTAAQESPKLVGTMRQLFQLVLQESIETKDIKDDSIWLDPKPRCTNGMVKPAYNCLCNTSCMCKYNVSSEYLEYEWYDIE